MIALRTSAMEDEVKTAEVAAWCSYESPSSLKNDSRCLQLNEIRALGLHDNQTEALPHESFDSALNSRKVTCTSRFQALPT